MKLLFETQSGSSFAIEVDNSDTLLLVKQKIETSQNIPVSKQALAVDGVVIPREDLTVEQCEITKETRLQVLVSPEKKPNHNNDQVLPPEQSPEPFISVEEYFAMQDWPLTAEEIENIYSYQPVMAQTEESPSSSNLVTENTDNVQDSPVRNNNQSQLSDAAKQIINSNQDSTVTVQTEESTPSSNSVNEYVNIPMTKIPIRVSYLREGHPRKFLTTVNKKDHVRRLRKMVHNLDYEYVFKHKERVLNEDQSFQCNGVGFLSTIEVVPNP